MKFLSIFFCLGISLTSAAQTASKWSFGTHVGLNSSWLAMEREVVWQGGARHNAIAPGFTPCAGVQFNFQFAKRSFLQTEINYSLVKSSSTNRWQSTATTYTEHNTRFTNNYLEMPLLMNYAIAQQSKIKFSIGIGNVFRYGLKGKVDVEIREGGSSGTSNFRGSPVNLSDNIDFILICPAIRSSVGFKLKNHDAIGISLRYSVSAGKALRNETPPNYGFLISDNRLQTLSLLMQYTFPAIRNL